MKPLFPYFGGKSSIADVIWRHLGDVGSYVEPFFGSGAVQRRPDLVYDRLRGISYSEHDLRAAKRLVYSTDLSEKLAELGKELLSRPNRPAFRALMTMAESRGYTHALYKGEPYNISEWLDRVGRDNA